MLKSFDLKRLQLGDTRKGNIMISKILKDIVRQVVRDAVTVEVDKLLAAHDDRIAKYEQAAELLELGDGLAAKALKVVEIFNNQKPGTDGQRATYVLGPEHLNSLRHLETLAASFRKEKRSL